MSEEDRQQKFVVQLTEHQNRVYGYIFSMLGDHTVAADVLQETNLVLWRRSAEWIPDAPFLPWAFTVARFQVLAHVRDRKRERCLLDIELVEALSVDVAAESNRLEQTRDAPRADRRRAWNRPVHRRRARDRPPDEGAGHRRDRARRQRAARTRRAAEHHRRARQHTEDQAPTGVLRSGCRPAGRRARRGADEALSVRRTDSLPAAN